VALEQLTNFQASGYEIGELQLFRNVEQKSVVRMLADCPVIRVAAGQTVTDPPRRGAHLYVVLRGELGVASGQQWGMEEGAVITVLPGECVGELSVFDEQAAAPTITAMQETELLAIEAGKLWQMIDESNGVARNLLHLLSFRIQATNARLRQRQKVGKFYQQLSMLDGLTSLHNRAWLDDRLPALVEEARSSARPLTVIMLDIDHFKQFNDVHGHQAGDDALRAAARVFGEALRPTDHSARYGGEEFCVILPGSDSRAGAMVAQRLCERMRQAVVFGDMRQPLPHMTASFGVATLENGQDALGLLACADQALYRAKDAGRDRVVLHGGEE